MPAITQEQLKAQERLREQMRLMTNQATANKRPSMMEAITDQIKISQDSLEKNHELKALWDKSDDVKRFVEIIDSMRN